MKPLPTHQKLRGGYYTPIAIANFLARWAISSPCVSVLEPSCGDGSLLEAAVKTLIECGGDASKSVDLVHGVEIEPNEATKALERIRSIDKSLSPLKIHIGDFFAYCKNDLLGNRDFDVVIGNPPFVRYQNFPEQSRFVAFDLMKEAGLHPNKLTNSWVPFLVASTLILKPNGRLAMVIPAELLQVNYAAELRYFLSEFYKTITLITFRKLIFEGVQQEVVLLLGERSEGGHTGIRVIELDGVSDLNRYSYGSFPINDLKEMDHSTEKWTLYFLDNDEIHLLRKLKKHPNLTLSGKVIDVDVGIVTGLNKFFVLNEQQVKQHLLQAYVQPIVGRSTFLKGAIFSKLDWDGSVLKDAAAFLLTLPVQDKSDLPNDVYRYVVSGEDAGFHKGYKCRIRKRWYVVPSVWTPDAFMLRQIHHYPKVIVNEAGATCTDTIHRVRMRNGANKKMVAAAFLNSLTFAFSEVTGRSYGGGVLELEPNEAERLPLPLIGAEKLDLDEIDRHLRADRIDAVLDITDQILLRDGLGLSDDEIRMLRQIWKKLRDRRINRKHKIKTDYDS